MGIMRQIILCSLIYFFWLLFNSYKDLNLFMLYLGFFFPSLQSFAVTHVDANDGGKF